MIEKDISFVDSERSEECIGLTIVYFIFKVPICIFLKFLVGVLYDYTFSNCQLNLVSSNLKKVYRHCQS